MAESHFEKQGYWWLPDDPQRQIPGTLVFGHDVSSELRLLGSMQNGVDALEIFSRGGRDFEPPVILGTSSDGKDYTLITCVRIGFNLNTYITESFFPSIVIEGRHFASKDELIFQSMTLRISHLDEWYQKTGREVSWEHTDGISPTLHLRYRRPEFVSASYGDGYFEIGHDFNVKQALFASDFVVSESACMSVVPIQPLHLDEFLDGCIAAIIAFISIGVGQPLSIKDLRAKVAKDCEGLTSEKQLRVQSIKLFWKKKYTKNDDKLLLPHDMIFTFPDLHVRLSEYLTKWLKHYKTIKPVMQLFFGRVMTADAVSPNTFLNAVQAAEAYHRYQRNGEEIPKAEHKERLSKIKDAIPPEFQKWFSQKLCFSNEKPLRQRLNELLLERSDLLKLTPDEIDNIAKRTTEIRNFYTHYTRKKSDEDFGTGEELYVLSTIMKWLVIANLLEDLGLSREESHSLIGKNQSFLFFRTTYILKAQPQIFNAERLPTPQTPDVNCE